MNLHLALAASAALLALAFALSTLERWIDRRKPHEGAWTVALFLFSAASLALWGGAAFGWNGVWFRLFYLFGAIVNVPYLALGTIYLLSPLHVARRVADRSPRLRRLQRRCDRRGATHRPDRRRHAAAGQ